MTTIRTRIAPSPTGFFHIGNAKTALYNWLVARQQNGTFILRLEDTDAERSKEEYAKIMGEALTWLGIAWDEGPGFDGAPDTGEYGPYRQSQRTDLYLKEIQRLLDAGKAYKCFWTKEEIETEREQARAEKRAPKRSPWRDASAEDVDAQGDKPYAIRFRVPEKGVTALDDILQGVVKVDNKEIDDFLIVKPNGDPVFHVAVVVDDGLMKVSHVIRGDDHLTNAAKHVLLFEALGYDLPKFAHHPLVHDEHGKKYSKRLHGANVLDWREDGYLPETIVNYLALLGWAPADDREVFSPEELIQEFSIERMSLSPARFDLKKIQWLNGQHIRKLSVEELRNRLVPIMENAGLDVASKSEEWLSQMTVICQEKIATLNDIVSFTGFFFADPTEYEEKAVKKHLKKAGVLQRMEALTDKLRAQQDWTTAPLHDAFKALTETLEVGFGKLIHPARLAFTGKSVGPGLFELAELLGKETCLARLERAMEYVKSLEGEAS